MSRVHIPGEIGAGMIGGPAQDEESPKKQQGGALNEDFGCV
jgi:hypothetical protein